MTNHHGNEKETQRKLLEFCFKGVRFVTDMSTTVVGNRPQYEYSLKSSSGL
jgi:hypothetical protein